MTKAEAEQLLGLTSEPYDSEMVKKAKRVLLVRYSMNKAARDEGVTDEEARTMTPIIRAAGTVLLRAVGQSDTGVVTPDAMGGGSTDNGDADAWQRPAGRPVDKGGDARRRSASNRRGRGAASPAEESPDTDAWARAAASWMGQDAPSGDESERGGSTTNRAERPRPRRGAGDGQRRQGGRPPRGRQARPARQTPRPEDVPITKNKLLAPISRMLRALGSDVAKLGIAVFVVGGLPAALALQPTIGLLMNPDTADSGWATAGLVVIAIGVTICVLESRKLISPRLARFLLGTAVGIDLSDARGGMLAAVLKVVAWAGGKIGGFVGGVGRWIWNWLKEASKG